MIKFCYLRRNEFEQYANSLFSILCDNMSQIVPTGNSPEEDYELWLHSQKEEINKGKHHIIVIFQKETQEIVGYFQYSVQGNVFLMEEIQIKEKYQGKYNIFRRLYGFVLDNIGTDVSYVEAYANKKNAKSIGILGKLGLSIAGENKSGSSYYFRGAYVDLLNWIKEIDS